MYQTGGTYANENIKHARLDYQSQYPDSSCRGSDPDPACHQGLAVFPLGGCVTSIKVSSTNDGRTRPSIRNAPGFDGYDGCCKNVDQQAKHYIGEYREVDGVDEGTGTLPACVPDNENPGGRCDHNQVNNWKCFEEHG